MKIKFDFNAFIALLVMPHCKQHLLSKHTLSSSHDLSEIVTLFMLSLGFIWLKLFIPLCVSKSGWMEEGMDADFVADFLVKQILN